MEAISFEIRMDHHAKNGHFNAPKAFYEVNEVVRVNEEGEEYTVEEYEMDSDAIPVKKVYTVAKNAQVTLEGTSGFCVHLDPGDEVELLSVKSGNGVGFTVRKKRIPSTVHENFQTMSFSRFHRTMGRFLK